MITYEGKRDFDQLCADNADYGSLRRVERESHAVAELEGVDNRVRRLSHGPCPTMEMRSVAELERLWSGVAMAIAGCKRELLAAVDQTAGLTCEQKDCLREAAESLTPHVAKAMHDRREHYEHYRVLFNENERAGR